MSIEKIAELCDGKMNMRAEAMKGESIKGVSIDTRTLGENNLFIPFRGEHVDGHRFIEQAFRAGAALSLTEQEPGAVDPDLPLIHVGDGLVALQDIARGYLQEVSPKVIAITGSNGKTTTKDMVECLLAPHFRVKKTIGNYNNEIGLPLTILQLDRDTEISILEMGMDAKGDIHFLSRMTKPDIAILTNVGESHIEKLGSRENIAEAKYEIVDGLKEAGTFIYSRDYPLLENIVDREASYNVRSAGESGKNDLQIANVRQTDQGTRFRLHPLDIEVRIPQLGLHNASNATLALLAAEAAGLDINEVKGHFDNLVVTDMRMEQTRHPSGATIINDAYNASPSSMKSAIDTVGRMEAGRRILVLGDILELGSYSHELHRSVAQHINDAPYFFDYLLTYGEAAKTIHEKAEVEGKHHYGEIGDLAQHLQQVLTEDSVVLLKGSRGMALERVNDYI
ncbi:UDP-N-acetylmuramoyl-tripeptide--D-alanyl-D-alanine ligase [Salinicoccus bachuensis]|uniref:UDP-N-acetylmuramoyl-tripeptide--D-alanyl-D-alanine ligase n=1 Tax=Salinicoccus bachuensis TaxID=3136731 RepID=A0ABZ3CJ05_9STAP